jgi:1,4-alpha-glucan branching enzyme
MHGYVSLILHAHLPFVRHPEHESFLEENWLFEAITETYIPLLKVLQAWQREGIGARLALTLTPTLCAMLRDELLQTRFAGYLESRIELSEKEVRRTRWEKRINGLAQFYQDRYCSVRAFYQSCGGDLVGAFSALQDQGQIEIAASAATHALLPLLAQHLPSVRAQILVGRDYYRECFGRDPKGIWLPECAYVEGLDKVLQEANLRWFVVDTHGILHAQPRPRYGIFAPIFLPSGVAVFGRDTASAKQVWSRDEGYPGDPRYRDFYRDIGFDLDLDYVSPYLPVPDQRSFTGLKYHRITGAGASKELYDRKAALEAADSHAGHFLSARMVQIQRLLEIMDRPPLVLCPYDAELFGHWWFEGPEFLDLFVRKAYFDQKTFALLTPDDYLRRHATHQLAVPALSSWGEEGYWRMWLNETNQWIYPHLHFAQERMSELARGFGETRDPGHSSAPCLARTVLERALRQASRELLLAQASDWPFILKTGTSPDYARKRVNEHLHRFGKIYSQIMESQIDEAWLAEIELRDNVFPNVDYRYWQ